MICTGTSHNLEISVSLLQIRVKSSIIDTYVFKKRIALFNFSLFLCCNYFHGKFNSCQINRFALFPVCSAIPCGLILFPFTFLVADLVTQNSEGPKARLMIYLGLTLCILSQLILMIGIKLTHPNGYEDPDFFQNSFSAIFGLNGIAF